MSSPTLPTNTDDTWLMEERVALATRRRLESRAAERVRMGQGSGGLLDEVELREAERWLVSADSSTEAGYRISKTGGRISEIGFCG